MAAGRAAHSPIRARSPDYICYRTPPIQPGRSRPGSPAPRWWFAECFQQAKNEAALDHYQVRTWRAWYAHSTCPCSPWPGWPARKPLPQKGNRRPRPRHDQLHATGDPPTARAPDSATRPRTRPRLDLVTLATTTPTPSPRQPLPHPRLPTISAVAVLGDVPIIFADTETTNWAFDPIRRQYYWHRFYAHQPDLNYANPAVRAEILNALRFWLEAWALTGSASTPSPTSTPERARAARICQRRTPFCASCGQCWTRSTRTGSSWPSRRPAGPGRRLLRVRKRVSHGIQLSARCPGSSLPCAARIAPRSPE